VFATTGPECARKRSERMSLDYLGAAGAGVDAGLLAGAEVLEQPVLAQTKATTRSNAINFFTVKPSFQL
jgi:hypothetical protein